MSKDYILDLHKLNGIMVKIDDEYIQLVVCLADDGVEIDVDFRAFFGTVEIDEDKAKRIIDMAYEILSKEK